MNEIKIKLPISARELELKLHSYCDHHGWDVMVVEDSEEGGVDNKISLVAVTSNKASGSLK